MNIIEILLLLGIMVVLFLSFRLICKSFLKNRETKNTRKSERGF